MASGTTTWDERLESLHGLPPGGFGGTFDDWVAALHPDDRAECIALVEEALANPGTYRLYHRSIWPDGSVHSIECRGTVLTDASGQPIGTTGVAFDVTAQQNVVDTLQRALLPAFLPRVPGVTLASRYRAADDQTDIGGDWYAAISLPDGCVGLAIGDVAGHGLGAVAQMAAARFSLRALALDELRPEVVLDRLNNVVRSFHENALITTTYGIVDPREKTWTSATAGHVPPLVRSESGDVSFLDTKPGPPLGVETEFVSTTIGLEGSSHLLLYTDGLIERRKEDLDRGLARLKSVARTAPQDPELFCDAILEGMIGNRTMTDDVALVVVALN
jgi:sigma-B regulation protein RsbU (phosphoserine phosphatase)